MQLFFLQNNVLLRETKQMQKTVILSMLMANHLELYRLHGSSIPFVGIQIKASSYKSNKNHSKNLFGLRQVKEQQIWNPESQFTGE